MVFVLLFFLFFDFDFASPSTFDFELFDLFLVLDAFLFDTAEKDAYFDLSVLDFDLLFDDFDLLYFRDFLPTPLLQFSKSCPL